MPTYSYECDACGHKFDKFQSMKDESLTKCPECKKKKLRRLFGTGAAIMFKGSGFYITDYRSDSYKKSAEADSKSASVSTDSNASKSESTTPAAKSESKGSESAKPTPKKAAE